jgi:hypothetical protein
MLTIYENLKLFIDRFAHLEKNNYQYTRFFMQIDEKELSKFINGYEIGVLHEILGQQDQILNQKPNGGKGRGSEDNKGKALVMHMLHV